MDSAKYHCRFIEKAPTMNMKKGEMIAVMLNHDTEIPNSIPTKSVLLEKNLIILKDIEKQYAIIAWLKKPAILFYGCLRFIAYWIP